MAWITVTSQTGQLIAAAELNQLRDNFLLLGTHSHATGVGSGGGATTILMPSATASESERQIAITNVGNLSSPTGTAVRFFSTGSLMVGRNATGSITLINNTHAH